MTQPDLAELIKRTEGAQPWRKVFHATIALGMAAAITLLPLSHRELVGALAAIFVLLAVADRVRMKNVAANRLFFTIFGKLASPREARGLASSTWYALGIFVAVALFPPPQAISGVLVMGLADPAAGYVGRRWGRRPFMGGTRLGSAAFFAVSVAVIASRHSVLPALFTGLLATVLERRSWPLDDNLTIPAVTAAVLSGWAAWM